MSLPDDWWNRFGVVQRHLFLSWVGDLDAPSRRLARHRIRQAGYRSLLDCGCGVCQENDGFIREGYGIAYQGIDTCRSFVEEGRARGLAVEEASIERIPLPDQSVDVVYLRHVLEHLTDCRCAIAEAMRVARKEVMTVFFLKPQQMAQHRSDIVDGVVVRHNTHALGDVLRCVHEQPRPSVVEWEELEQESIMRIRFVGRPRLLIGALSGMRMHERRVRCRETWIADAHRVGVDVVFLIGAAGKVLEATRVDDLLLLPCPDDYPSLPQRTRWLIVQLLFCK